MSISGSLEDVSVADVMQFIHLGRRTGTLTLAQGDDHAMIGFHTGKLVSAKGPTTPQLGDLLLSAGMIQQDALAEAVEEQAADLEKRSLGQILTSSGRIENEALRQVISQQIEQTISDLMVWHTGTFEFAVDDLRPIDDIALYPGQIVPDTDINTQMVLLEAARIFDERNRSEGAAEAKAEPEAEEPPASSLDDTHPVVEEPEEAEAETAWSGIDADEQLAALVGPQLSPAEEHVLQIVSKDEDFSRRLEAAVPDQVTSVERMELDQAGHTADGRLSPIVLVDLRESQATLEDIASFHERISTAPVIALVDRVVPVSQVYGAGALAALPAEVEAVVACVVNVMQSQQQLALVHTPRRPARKAADMSGVDRLRRVFGDLRSGLLSATVALNLMHIISESVERAVLFLVRKDCLQALGAFGLGSSGRPLAELTRGLKLDLEEDNVLIESLNSGEAIPVAYDAAELPRSLSGILGKPLNGQIVVFPVLGAQRVISVIYTDNGGIDRAIEDIDILELATAQVGMAFENELLRRQIEHDH